MKHSEENGALASVAPLVGRHPEHQNVAGSIPSGQGTGLGCGSIPGCSLSHSHIDVSLSLVLFLSLKPNENVF